MDLVEEHQSQELPNAGDRAQAGEGLGIVGLGGLDQGQLSLGEQPVVVAEQPKVYRDAFGHGGIGKAFSDPLPVGLVSKALADLGQIAWSSYPRLFPSPAEMMSSRGSYATTLAMMCLVRLNKPTYYETSIDQETLGNQIDKGVRWVFSEYNSEIKG